MGCYYTSEPDFNIMATLWLRRVGLIVIGVFEWAGLVARGVRLVTLVNFSFHSIPTKKIPKSCPPPPPHSPIWSSTHPTVPSPPHTRIRVPGTSWNIWRPCWGPSLERFTTWRGFRRYWGERRGGRVDTLKLMQLTELFTENKLIK